MEIKDILYNRRKELDLTMKQVADMVGVSEGTVSRWESGEIANMRRDKIMDYAKALKISPAVIMGWEDEDKPSHGIRIPVFDRVAAGIPIDAIEDVVEWEEIPEELARTGEYFGLRIKGDSMMPRIAEGDVVIVTRAEILYLSGLPAIRVIYCVIYMKNAPGTASCKCRGLVFCTDIAIYSTFFVVFY